MVCKITLELFLEELTEEKKCYRHLQQNTALTPTTENSVQALQSGSYE
jgi:hypothetical protein